MKRLLFLALLVPALALAIYDVKPFDLNRWDVLIYNDGRWAYDPSIPDNFPGVPASVYLQ